MTSRTSKSQAILITCVDCRYLFDLKIRPQGSTTDTLLKCELCSDPAAVYAYLPYDTQVFARHAHMFF